LGQVDPGPSHLDCGGLAGLEFSTAWFDSFESDMPDDPMHIGIASGWAGYDDLTQYAFHVPGDATWYPDLVKNRAFSAPWGLPADNTFHGPSCDGKPNNWSMRYRGGLFRKWGGGMSHAFTDPVGRYRLTPSDACPPDVDFCPPPVPPGATVDTAGIPLKAKSGDEYLQSHDFLDVSNYDGVGFWARRGPEGYDRVLVILTDKFTSSRLARENETYCRRVRECHTQCLNGAPCTLTNPNSTMPVWRCFDPTKVSPDAPPSSMCSLPTVSTESELDLMYPRCGASACTSPNSYLDKDFDDKACRPYTFPAADEYGEYCWNENDLPPPDRDSRCQDGWQRTVELTPDWKFHALPFADFSQVGFGKRAPYMDLKSLDTIAFGSPGPGTWSDVYIDNVTFYRRKK
jgi:hypothetical protein